MPEPVSALVTRPWIVRVLESAVFVAGTWVAGVPGSDLRLSTREYGSEAAGDKSGCYLVGDRRHSIGLTRERREGYTNQLTTLFDSFTYNAYVR